MKCKLRIPMEQRNPAFDAAAAAEARRLRRPYRVPATITSPAGTEIDHPDAWRLVHLGVAEPLDEECQEVAGLTPDEIAEREARYRALEAGRATGDRQHDVPADTATEDEDE